jgi:hypothetical protein
MMQVHDGSLAQRCSFRFPTGALPAIIMAPPAFRAAAEDHVTP